MMLARPKNPSRDAGGSRNMGPAVEGQRQAAYSHEPRERRAQPGVHGVVARGTGRGLRHTQVHKVLTNLRHARATQKGAQARVRAKEGTLACVEKQASRLPEGKREVPTRMHRRNHSLQR